MLLIITEKCINFVKEYADYIAQYQVQESCIKDTYLCVLKLGREAANILAQFDIFPLCFIQQCRHTFQFNLH